MSDKTRIEGHRWAEEVVANVSEHDDADFRLGFWREIAKQLPPAHRPRAQTTLRPMSDQESRAFGNRRITYGEFAGQRYDDVPMERLDWYVVQSEELRRYVASRRVREEE